MTGVPSLPRTGLPDIYIAYPFRKCLQNIFSSMDLTNLQTPMAVGNFLFLRIT
jgi:hypothetical protein